MQPKLFLPWGYLNCCSAPYSYVCADELLRAFSVSFYSQYIQLVYEHLNFLACLSSDFTSGTEFLLFPILWFVTVFSDSETHTLQGYDH